MGCVILNLQDYTGENVTAENLYAVLLGDKNKVKGGSGKVINSKPEDRIFIYYSDHGGPGVLGESSMIFNFAVIPMDLIMSWHESWPNCKPLHFVVYSL